MQEVLVIVKQIIMLGMLALLGFGAGKTKYLPESSGVILSRIVIKLTAPILIATTLANQKFSSAMLGDGLKIYVLGLVFLLFAYLIGWLTCNVLKISGAQGNVYKMHSMFGNVIFLAFPLLGALFGEKGIVYAVFFNLASDSLLWTLGIYLVNRHKTGAWKDNLKHLINGNTIAFAVGLLCIITNLQHYVEVNANVRYIYKLVYDTFNPLGHTTFYLSMLFIGLILSEIEINKFSEILKRYPIFILSFLKLILVPCIALVILYFLGDWVSPFVKTIVVLQLAMPCATIVPALASQYDSDYKFAAEAVFFSTILGIGTMPLMVYITKFFG
ncbi:MAG: AEC family transporter [Clostridia bacterium]|nr:AEC family transporter [Clostridia bacterium]